MSALIVLTLAIGIGANATMAGAIDQLLYRAPAFVSNPGELARLLVISPNPRGGEYVSVRSNYPMLLDLQREVSSFNGVAGFVSTRMSLGVGAEAVQLRVSMISATYFSLLGVHPALGRFFNRSDGYPTGEAPGGAPLAVLAYGFWQRQFAGDSGVIGHPLRIGGGVYDIVGVAPRGFDGVDVDGPDVWLPITVAAEKELPWASLSDRGSVWLSLVARLKPDASRVRAEQQATALLRRYMQALGGGDSLARSVAAPIIRGRGPDAPREVRVALWLGGVSALVLLIACANVANLQLGRAYARRHEIAVRLAMGAGRGRLARQMLTEVLLLTGLGGAAAAGLANAGGQLVQRLLVTGGYAHGFVTSRLVVYTAAVALSAAVLISFAPLMQSASLDLTSSLRTGAAVGGGRSSRVRAALLAVQSTLCVLLLVGAALFSLSLQRVEGIDLGVDVDHTLVASFDLHPLNLPKGEADATCQMMLDQVRSIPGVRAASLAVGNPNGGGRAVAAHPISRHQDFYWHKGVVEIPMEAAVGSGFFHAVGTASLRGRDFTDGDRDGAARVAIINEPLARILWPGADPLGKCLVLPARASDAGGDCVTVVGVLRGFWKYAILRREVLAVYIPLAQRTAASGSAPPSSIYIRVSDDAPGVASEVRRAIQRVRQDLPATSVVRMADVVAPELKPWRLAAWMFALFGGMALAIAVIGLYGVVAFSAALRSREVAIRIALGASARHVLAVVAGDALRAVVAGLAVGIAGVLAARGWVGPLLFQTSADDPGIIFGVAFVLCLVAVLAALVPTVGMLRRNPAVSLRVD